jgi:hypothetical protein
MQSLKGGYLNNSSLTKASWINTRKFSRKNFLMWTTVFCQLCITRSSMVGFGWEHSTCLGYYYYFFIKKKKKTHILRSQQEEKQKLTSWLSKVQFFWAWSWIVLEMAICVRVSDLSCVDTCV